MKKRIVEANIWDFKCDFANGMLLQNELWTSDFGRRQIEEWLVHMKFMETFIS